MSETDPATPSPEPAPAPPDPAPPAPAAEDAAAPPGRPVLAATPGWVPPAVVAGTGLLLLGLVVSRIQPEGDAARVVGDISSVSMLLGFLALVSGYSAFLLARLPMARSIECVVLTAALLVDYYWGWRVLFTALSGDAYRLVGVEQMGLTGRGAALGAIVWLAAAVGFFAFAFQWLARLVWPYFRAGVALNVLAMVHLVVLLLGVVSYLNVKFVPRYLGTGIDLTETREFSLSDKTTAVLGKIEGDLTCFLVEYPDPRRGTSGLTPKVRDLLNQYRAVTPKIEFRSFDAARNDTDFKQALTEAGMSEVLDTITGDDDCVVFGYRPPGERLVARKKVVPIGPEFGDTSALGSARFKGEGILTNAISEVAFTQRRVLFLGGHGEKPISGGGGSGDSFAQMADALRNDNFGVSDRNLQQDPSIPPDTDAVILAGPTGGVSPPEVEALRAYLQKGGAVIVLLDVPNDLGSTRTGLEDFLEGWGIHPRRDAVIVSYVVEQTALLGAVAKPVLDVLCSRDEFGRHPAMEALRGSNFGVFFHVALPVFKAEKVPDGVQVDELVYAPREVNELKPFGALLRQGRGKDLQPAPGDITDKRLPIVVAAERKGGEGGKGAARVVVFGDTDFATDKRVDPQSPYTSPANRTLFLNVVSWAVRRDVIAIDPKTVETEVVTLRPVDRDLAFWCTVVALPLIALGVAVGVWWVRRR